MRRVRVLVLLGMVTVAAAAAMAGRSDTPSVRIDKPVDGQSIAGVFAITVLVDPHPDVTHVVVYRGDKPLGNDFEPPYRILWDTQWEPDGPVQLIAKALGRQYVVAESPPVRIVLDNTLPEAAVVEPADAETVDGITKIRATANDNTGVVTVRFLLNGVQLAELNRPPYEVEWDTAKGPNGNTALEVRAFDAAGNSAVSPPVGARVINANRPPVMQPIGVVTVAEGQPLDIPIHVSDPDAPRDTVTVKVSNVPTWAAFNTRNWTITGVPPSSEASLLHPSKLYSDVRAEACDPEPMCARQSFSIVVTDVNGAPRVKAPEDRIIKEGQLLSFGLARSDPDGDVLTCQAERIPQWLVLDDVRCTIEGTPDFELCSLKEPVVVLPLIWFKVCDPGGLCAKDDLVITVQNVDTSPILRPIGPQVIDEGRQLSIDIKAVDANADLLMLKADPLPEGAKFVDHKDGTATLTWTPRMDQGGQYETLVTVTDGEMVVEESVPITVRQRQLAISGNVWRGRSEDPMPDAIVRVSTGQGLVQEIKTDAKGRFLVADLHPGKYVIRAHYDFERGFSAQARKQDVVKIVPERVEVTLKNEDHPGVRFRVYLPAK